MMHMSIDGKNIIDLPKNRSEIYHESTQSIQWNLSWRLAWGLRNISFGSFVPHRPNPSFGKDSYEPYMALHKFKSEGSSTYTCFYILNICLTFKPLKFTINMYMKYTFHLSCPTLNSAEVLDTSSTWYIIFSSISYLYIFFSLSMIEVSRNSI